MTKKNEKQNAGSQPGGTDRGDAGSPPKPSLGTKRESDGIDGDEFGNQFGGGADASIPVLRIDVTQLPRSIAELVAAELSRTGNVFARDGALVRVRYDGPTQVRVEPLSHADLEFRLPECVEFFTPAKPEKRAVCPRSVIGQLLRFPGQFGFRTLQGVAHGGVLRADGSFFTQSGFDAASGYFVVGGLEAISAHPTLDQAKEAKAVLDHLLREFRFIDDAHRAGAVAALLTLCARSRIRGFVPMIVVTAPTTGTGKTTLLDILGMIATGEVPFHAKARGSSSDLDALIASIVREQHPFAIVDNWNGMLTSSALASVTTSDCQLTRTMHSHNTKTASVRTLFAFTGIETRPSPELARRSLVIALKHPTGSAGETVYEVDEIMEHVRSRRQELLSCVHTILLHHIREGVDGIRLSPWNSFDSWSAVVRGALVRVGYADPIETMRAARDQTDFAPALRAALVCWLRRRADAGRARFQAQDLVNMLTAPDADPETEELVRLFLGAFDAGPSPIKGDINATNLGTIFSRLGVIEHDGHRLAATNAHGRRAWRVEPVDSESCEGGGGPILESDAPVRSNIVDPSGSDCAQLGAGSNDDTRGGLPERTSEGRSEGADSGRAASPLDAAAHVSDPSVSARIQVQDAISNSNHVASAPQFDDAFALLVRREPGNVESVASGASTARTLDGSVLSEKADVVKSSLMPDWD